MSTEKRLAPGVYVRGKEMRLDVPEMLAGYGIPDTEENRDMCIKVAGQVLRETGILTDATKQTHVHAHRCPRCSRKWEHTGKRVKCPLEKKTATCGRCNS
jgi:hypothetical protein